MKSAPISCILVLVEPQTVVLPKQETGSALVSDSYAAQDCTLSSTPSIDQILIHGRGAQNVVSVEDTIKDPSSQRSYFRYPL